MKKIAILGASGSIGTNTLNVLRNHQDKFSLVAFSVHSKVDLIEQILKEFKDVEIVGVRSLEEVSELVNKYKKVRFVEKEEGLFAVATSSCDVLVSALGGFVGLAPTIKAIEHKKDIALANKETLVAAGEIVMKKAKENNVKITPIDSEHSAIFQCLQGNPHKSIKRLIITASGGSFRDKTRAELEGVSVKQALSHPNWSMGAKITIDSASMMNKGLEVIEAHWLFDLPFSKIDTIMHRESVIHSMVEYEDTAVMAQLGTPDMRLPIQYALTYPSRLPLESEPLDLLKLSTLHFEPLSFERFPLLKLAYEVGEKGGNLPAIMNGANEAAVAMFLEEKISFLEIEEYVHKAVHDLEFIAHPTLEEVIASDKKARAYVIQCVKGA